MKLEKDRIKCICGHWAKPAELRIEGLALDGWKCPECQEEYLTPEASLQLSAFKQLQTHKSEAVVTKSGNSLAIRVKKEVAQAFGLHAGTRLIVALATPKKIEMQLA